MSILPQTFGDPTLLTAHRPVPMLPAGSPAGKPRRGSWHSLGCRWGQAGANPPPVGPSPGVLLPGRGRSGGQAAPRVPRPGAGVSPDPGASPPPPPHRPTLGLPPRRPSRRGQGGWVYTGFNGDGGTGVGCEAREHRLLRCWGCAGDGTGWDGTGWSPARGAAGVRPAAAGGSAWKRWGQARLSWGETGGRTGGHRPFSPTPSGWAPTAQGLGQPKSHPVGRGRGIPGRGKGDPSKRSSEGGGREGDGDSEPPRTPPGLA